MKKDIEEICKLIAPKLALNPEAFVEWVGLNNFDLYELAILGGQITYGRIDTLPLIMSVCDKTKYKIVAK